MALDILGIEEKLWTMADKLRGTMDASEYKHVVLGLLFLKYISDKFNIRYDELVAEGEDLEDKDYYTMKNVFFVPEEARWERIQQSAKDPQIGKIIDNALILIEDENESLKNVLDKRYSKSDLNKTKLGELVDVISGMPLYNKDGTDILGRVYEYFLGKFAALEGKLGGEFYTPSCVVKTLVNIIEPYEGRVYDPCCGSGGMFVQSGKFVLSHAGNINDISVYGQESNPTTLRLCKMNLAIHGIEADLGTQFADTLLEDLHSNVRFEYVLANPPFNVSDYGAEALTADSKGRFQFGMPPEGNANYAWLSHIYYHLTSNGVAGIVLANGSLSAGGQEGKIRKAMLKADIIDAIIALPSQLFSTTQIPACLWIMRKDKKARFDEVLFIDARSMGTMISRKDRELSEDEIMSIADTYHAWRDEKAEYADKKGFCYSASISEIAGHEYVLTPGRYVGTEDFDDGLDFDSEISRLSGELLSSMKESDKLDKAIKKIFSELVSSNE